MSTIAETLVTFADAVAAELPNDLAKIGVVANALDVAAAALATSSSGSTMGTRTHFFGTDSSSLHICGPALQTGEQVWCAKPANYVPTRDRAIEVHACLPS